MTYRIIAFFDIEVGGAESEKQAIEQARKWCGALHPDTINSMLNYTVRERKSDDEKEDGVFIAKNLSGEELKRIPDAKLPVSVSSPEIARDIRDMVSRRGK